MSKNLAFGDALEFLFQGRTPEDILEFRPSQEAQDRVRSLVQKEHDEVLSDDERAELEQHTYLNDLVTLAKARALETIATRK